VAQEQAENLLSKFSQPKAFPRIKFKRSSITKQYTTDLFGLITIDFTSFNITGEFRVGYIDRSWDIQSPNVIDTVVYFEPNLNIGTGATWIFPMSFPTTFPS
jgi:hypothetical protein